MQNGFITLPEALKVMQLRDRDGKPFPFDATYRTFNSQSKKGGKLKTLTGAKYLPDANPNAKHIDTLDNILDPLKTKRPPNHYENRTRNIETASGEIKTLRIDFLITINGKYINY